MHGPEMGDVSLPFSRSQILCVSWREQLTIRVILVFKEEFFHIAWLSAQAVCLPALLSPEQVAECVDN